MTNKEVAEECGYELKKGIVITATDKPSSCDIFHSEDEMEKYWYNETTDMFFKNTEKGLEELYQFEKKKREKEEN